MNNPAIHFSEMRFLPDSRNIGRPESLWLCDNLRCGAPIGGKWPWVRAGLPKPLAPLLICEQCAHRARSDREFCYSISEAA